MPAVPGGVVLVADLDFFGNLRDREEAARWRRYDYLVLYVMEMVDHSEYGGGSASTRPTAAVLPRTGLNRIAYYIIGHFSERGVSHLPRDGRSQTGVSVADSTGALNL